MLHLSHLLVSHLSHENSFNLYGTFNSEKSDAVDLEDCTTTIRRIVKVMCFSLSFWGLESVAHLKSLHIGIIIAHYI